MSYSKYYQNGWADNESGGTPITAASLNYMEDGIAAAQTAAEGAAGDAASALTSAKDYADQKLLDAKAYSNSNLNTAKSYTDTKSAAAKSYTDSLTGALDARISDLQGFVGYISGDIYGVEADFENKTFTRLAGAAGKTAGADFNSVNAFGGRRRCNITDSGVVTAYYGDAAFASGGALAQAVTKNGVTYPVGTHVQVMVEQPKFYYRVVPLKLDRIPEGGYILRKARYYVSDRPVPGFKVHPAFIRDGRENDRIYLAAFEGSVYDVSASSYILDDAQTTDFTPGTGDRLSSISGAKPAAGVSQRLTRTNARQLAHNRGAGWELSYAATVSASQLLMLIEYASFNMQAAIGMGVVSKASGSGNEAKLTGATLDLGNASGEAENANEQKPVSYRGEENLWGNVWCWVDGMNEKNPDTFGSGDHGALYVADHGFADDTVTGYQDSGINPVYASNAYISAFGYSPDCDWVFVPAETLGNSSLPVGDTLSNNAGGWRAVLLSSSWRGASSAGPFALSMFRESTNANREVGARLVYIP